MAIKNFAYDDFLHYKGVSRETFSLLQEYVELIKKWQPTINLIGNASLSDIWIRHIIDSAQLIDYTASDDVVADLGSGAGFPGLVMSIMGMKKVTLIESDQRKAAFLKEAARVTKAGAKVVNSRVEDVDMSKFSVITARAFSPLVALLGLIAASVNASHKLLLLKGKNYQSELQQARSGWSFDYTTHPSVTDKDSVILSLQNLKPTEAS